jgi:RNA polymerase sigma factor for flagellar operon FliA
MTAPSLWRRCADGDETARQQLLTEHLGLVHFVARQIARGLAADVDFDELVSAGTLGLMHALEAFDPSRGLAFSTFAAPRIRGSILDELRRQDHVPRSVRRKSREIGAAREQLTRTLGRAPDDREVAQQLGVDMDTLWKWQADVEGAVQVPIDRTPHDDEGGRGISPLEAMADDEAPGIDDQVNLGQEIDLLREAILKLKEQERLVLSLYYFEELKLHEIATMMHLTESRVSQIRSKAILRLRETMGAVRGGAAA